MITIFESFQDNEYILLKNLLDHLKNKYKQEEDAIERFEELANGMVNGGDISKKILKKFITDNNLDIEISETKSKNSKINTDSPSTIARRTRQMPSYDPCGSSGSYSSGGGCYSPPSRSGGCY